MKNIHFSSTSLKKEDRSRLKKQKVFLIWFTGLSGSGKSTLANELEKELYSKGYHTYILDGDNVRCGLNKDLGFDLSDREENIRRIAEVCKLFLDSGLIVLSAFISPLRKDREFVKNLLKDGEFIEVFVDSSLEVCEKRDTKGLYKKARKGEIKDFTGIDSVYEVPLKADIHLKTDTISIKDSVDSILKFLYENDYLKEDKKCQIDTR